jgi:quinohemoprotein ethanol dehydrogenase
VAVLAGWGGAFPISSGILHDDGGPVRNISRLLVFKLGGTAKLPPMPVLAESPLDPPPSKAPTATIMAGAKLYGRYCGVCHGDAAVGSTVLPDLRRSGALGDAKTWESVVHEGALKANGMAGFANVMTAADGESIRHYVIHRANEDKALELKAKGMNLAGK